MQDVCPSSDQSVSYNMTMNGLSYQSALYCERLHKEENIMDLITLERYLIWGIRATEWQSWLK
jgi:hypothetical protein